ncbi:hypothetical protein JCM10213v2_006166 [Rhodosporidiobolus nylandii]
MSSSAFFLPSLPSPAPLLAVEPPSHPPTPSTSATRRSSSSSSLSASRPGTARRTRKHVSCEGAAWMWWVCRIRKVKCSRELPCAMCKMSKRECIYKDCEPLTSDSNGTSTSDASSSELVAQLSHDLRAANLEINRLNSVVLDLQRQNLSLPTPPPGLGVSVLPPTPLSPEFPDADPLSLPPAPTVEPFSPTHHPHAALPFPVLQSAASLHLDTHHVPHLPYTLSSSAPPTSSLRFLPPSPLSLPSPQPPTPAQVYGDDDGGELQLFPLPLPLPLPHPPRRTVSFGGISGVPLPPVLEAGEKGEGRSSSAP